MKSILFDSSTLISMAMTCGCPILEKLHEDYGGDFYISSSVKRETIDRAARSRRFKYEGYRLQQLISKGVIKIYDESKLASQISNLTNQANSICHVRGKPVKVIHPGEISLLAIVKAIGADALAIDERATRLLVEAPERLPRLMERKLHERVEIDRKRLEQINKEFRTIRIIRSADLALAAFKKGYYGKPTKELFEGVIWALKFAGCAISEKEINDYMYKLI